jgi:cytochrome c biogenesis protein
VPLKMKKPLFSFLSSLKLTIILLIIIAVASIVGTIIPQQYEGGEAFRHLSPGLVKVFNSLQLFDMYHSIWFILLMVLLSLNLIVCSLNRWKASWKLFSNVPSPDRKKPFENLHPENVLLIKKDRNEVISGVENFLRRKFKKFRRKDADRITYFYGEKGAYSNFGVYIIHLSILIIITGAIIGSLLGFEAFVNIPEGESTNTVHLTRQKGAKKLDFTVRCDTFAISFYDNGMPKEYRSNLSFLKDNTVILQGPLLVNHPITFNGIRFYQASYGPIPGGRAHITVRRENKQETTITVKQKDSFFLNEKNAKVNIVKIEKNFMSMGPAVLMHIQNPKGTVRIWVFSRIEQIKDRIPDLIKKVPTFNPGRYTPYYFELNGIESNYYTGLQLSHDPGVGIVAIGSLFVILGLFVTFFSSHKRLWIKVGEQDGKTRISVGARSNRDPVGLKREVEYLLRHFSSIG